MIIDTHCHLDFEVFQDDLDEVLERSNVAGVRRFVTPATDLSSSKSVINLSAKYPEIFCAVGIHPSEATNFSYRDIDILRELSLNDKVVAIGEIGLDNFHKDVELSRQIVTFEAQLDLAAELELPVIIHNREADDEMLRILPQWLERHNISGRPPGIMHAFSSSDKFARFVSDLGFLIGIAGPITYKNAADKREIVRGLSRDHIVIETDAPFLTPVPFRGKRNEPAYTVYIVDSLSQLWNVTTTEVMNITTKNACRIFQWPNLN